MNFLQILGGLLHENCKISRIPNSREILQFPGNREMKKWPGSRDSGNGKFPGAITTIGLRGTISINEQLLW